APDPTRSCGDVRAAPSRPARRPRRVAFRAPGGVRAGRGGPAVGAGGGRVRFHRRGGVPAATRGLRRGAFPPGRARGHRQQAARRGRRGDGGVGFAGRRRHGAGLDAAVGRRLRPDPGSGRDGGAAQPAGLERDRRRPGPLRPPDPRRAVPSTGTGHRPFGRRPRSAVVAARPRRAGRRGGGRRHHQRARGGRRRPSDPLRRTVGRDLSPRGDRRTGRLRGDGGGPARHRPCAPRQARAGDRL
ncbi:MAG: FIG00777194: hypothetical protein, partial [uncultured Acetobacteraceae bacterium]